jgi:ATP/maltotriose-dependent transcriptional regulator MalT
LLTALLNEVADAPGQFALVLDDYHLIESDTVDQPSRCSSSGCPRSCTC